VKQNVARRPRFQRVSDLPPIRLTTRDKAILSTVCRYRYLTASHILSLVSGSRQNIVRRLQRLYHAGFLDRPRAQLPLRFAGNLSEIVYAPTRKTIAHCQGDAGKSDPRETYKQTTSQFLSHALSVSDSLISIESACKKSGIRFVGEEEILDSLPAAEIASRIQWRVGIKSGTATEKVGVIPDALFAIDRAGSADSSRRLFFFLESDRGTMPIHRKSLQLSSIRRKALAYAQSRRSKILKERFDMPGFQVLFVTHSRNRLEGIREESQASTNDRASSLFLYATDDELRHDPLRVLRMI